jgi:photosystem II stability/assembly factor-like uncharacterized protein
MPCCSLPQTALTARHRTFAAPGVYGNDVVEPVSWCAHRTVRARLFVSSDDGLHWAREPAVELGAVPVSGYSRPDCQPVATAVPDADDVRVAALATGRRLVVTRTCDQGRHWHAVRPPGLRVLDGVGISAADCLHALLEARDHRGIEHLFVTIDGGSKWHSIDERAGG